MNWKFAALALALTWAGPTRAQYLHTDDKKCPRDYRRLTPIQPCSPRLFDQVPWQEIGPGQRRKVLFNDRLTMVLLELSNTPADAPFSTHYHAHDQITMILEGRARVRVGEEEREVEAGAAYVAPSNVHHGLKPLTPRFVLVECFTPTREDFRGSPTPPKPKACSPNQVRSLVYDWFGLFDQQASPEEHLLRLDPQGFRLEFPEKSLSTAEQFRQWNDEIRRQFPDVSHQVRRLEVQPSSQGFNLQLEVGWSVAGQPPQFFRQLWEVRDWEGFPVITRIQVQPL